MGNDLAGLSLDEVRRLAEKGDADAQGWLGHLCYTGEQGVRRDPRAAVKWWTLAAQQDDLTGLVNLAALYFNGEDVPQDKVKGVTMLRRAAELGVAEAQFKLALAARYGEGTAQNNAESLAWLTKAARQGHAGAMNLLGKLYLGDSGGMVAPDEQTAAQWLAKAANAGNAEAMWALALLAAKSGASGWSEELRLCKMSARHGCVPAMTHLGDLLLNGYRGAEQNVAGGLRWLRKAVDAGDERAQDLLDQYENEQREAMEESRSNSEGPGVFEIAAGVGLGNLLSGWLSGKDKH